MTVADDVAALLAKDVELYIREGVLRYRAPAGTMTDEYRCQIGAMRLLERIPRRREVSNGRILPPSEAQKAIWFLEQLYSASAIHHIIYAMRVHSPIDFNAFCRAIDVLVRRHPVLRTTYPSIDGEPLQYVHDAANIHPEIVRVPNANAEELIHLMQTRSNQPFDLERDWMLRVDIFSLDEGDGALTLTLHHIAGDGKSLWNLLSELRGIYRAERDGAVCELEPIGHAYREYVAAERKLLTGSARDRLSSFWQEHLREAPQSLNLATDHPRKPGVPIIGSSYGFAIDAATTSLARECARANGTTLFSVLLAVYAALLERYTGQDDVVVATPVSRRSTGNFEHTIGNFVNTVILRLSVAGNPSFIELVKRVRDTVSLCLAHAAYPFSMLVEQLRIERESGRAPVSETMFGLQRLIDAADLVGMPDVTGLSQAVDFGGVNATPIAMSQQHGFYDLAFECLDIGTELRVTIKYSAHLFEPSTIERIGCHYQQLLASALSEQLCHIDSLAMLTGEERHRLLVEWNRTTAPYPADQRIEALVMREARHHPHRPAVAFGERVLSYGELDRWSELLAGSLQDKGIGRGAMVGVRIGRSIELVVALCGILKSGAAFVPLDPSYPEERIAGMLLDLPEATVVLNQSDLTSIGVESHVAATSTTLRDTTGDNTNAGGGASTDVAYVVFTSGSSGKPKGATCTHQGLVNMITAFQAYRSLGPGDRCGLWSSVSFDASLYEIFTALAAGATVHVCPDEVRSDTEQYIRWLEREAITSAFIPPVAMVQLVSMLRRGTFRSSLRRLLVGGEASDERVLVEVARALPDVCLLHGYGPTETSVVSHLTVVESGVALDRSAPIGGPIQNLKSYLLDARRRPVPVGVSGEIYIGGIGVGKGYINMADETAARFLVNPVLGPGESIPTDDVLYRTGDVARYLPDGRMLFVGRADHQVKLRGIRIELGEIEAVLLNHPDVREAAVMVREDVRADQRLVAYVALHKDANSTSDLQGQLRSRLRAKLPAHMVPSAFVILDAMPLSPNGKVERRALPPPSTQRPELETPFVAAESEAERLIARVWCDVLGTDSVGVHDNFFDLGGHSMLALQVLGKMREELGQDRSQTVTVVDLFQSPTVASLARLLANRECAVHAQSNDVDLERKLAQGQGRLAARRNLSQLATEVSSLSRNDQQGQMAAIAADPPGHVQD